MDNRSGAPGLVDDYEEMFGLKGVRPCLTALHLLGMKKGIANKRRCPCCSGRRLGKCHSHQLSPLSRMARGSYFRREAVFLDQQFEVYARYLERQGRRGEAEEWRR